MEESYAGVERLNIELGKSDELTARIRTYVNIVSAISSAIKEQRLEDNEELFFSDLASELNSQNIVAKLDIKDDLLVSALVSGDWDCDTLSFLVFDILKKVGIKSKIVLIAEHVYIRTNSGYFEPTTGQYYLKPTLPVHTKKIYYEGSDIAKIQAITYNVMGEHYSSDRKSTGVLYDLISVFGLERMCDKSLKCYTEAIKRIPNYAVAYNNRGNRYRSLGDNTKAITDYTKSISIDPDYSHAYGNRGRAYAQNYKFREAISDFQIAIQKEEDSKEKSELENLHQYCLNQIKYQPNK